ncbi:hypothetical protein FSP39_006742 [Pinctada imbricata]|uniref:THAP-type domain-containing protein n=1 Tax=Pinctada imbricata TaxID=66713 RepID=A0AA89C8Z5_PINIB|nr:hypothetical protein FSP39_006742 [Pinctada imbricata]
MGKGCCACKAVSTGVFKANGVRFYRFPVDVKKREAWVRAVSDAKGTKLWSLKSHHSLCSLHFISGEHSADPRHPDFAPTIFFKDAKEVLRRGKERKNRANAREKKKVCNDLGSFIYCNISKDNNN